MSSILADQYISPNAGGGRCRVSLSQWVRLYTGAQINFGDLTPYLTYMTMALYCDPTPYLFQNLCSGNITIDQLVGLMMVPRPLTSAIWLKSFHECESKRIPPLREVETTATASRPEQFSSINIIWLCWCIIFFDPIFFLLIIRKSIGSFFSYIMTYG